MGMWLTGTEDMTVLILLAVLILLHLGGIWLIVYLEEQKVKPRKTKEKIEKESE